MKAKVVYQLTLEDLRGLGQMGSTSKIIGRRLFSTELKAKKFAEADYKARQESSVAPRSVRFSTTFEWKQNSTYISSGDLSYIMYTISPQPVL